MRVTIELVERNEEGEEIARHPLEFAEGGAAKVHLVNRIRGENEILDVMEVIDGAGEGESVPASATTQMLGSTGAAGDYLAALLVIPATTSPGAISIKDGGATAVNVFAGGTVPDLRPFVIPIHEFSLNGGWQVTTGANVSVRARGKFS